jgi:NAD(P)-dependent dehydrogenase (short-subunit alcohol dehydrogenase family)
VNELPLQGQVAVVTGASSGLGRHFATVLHGAGARVVAAARRVDRLDSLAEELGEGLLPVACDVADGPDCERLVASAIDRFGAIDVLVNNAGASNPTPAEDETVEAFRAVLEVNVVAVFRLSQLVGRHMLERGSGSIVNVASIFGLVGAAPMDHASYCASKGAVVNLTRELGSQWASRGVRVNALAPGFFESEMTESVWSDEAATRHVLRNTPARRRGEPHELDAALLLLAGEGSSFISGHVLTVDGGWTAR